MSRVKQEGILSGSEPHFPIVFAGHCGKCLRVKGRRERKRQYCQKDFGESEPFSFV